MKRLLVDKVEGGRAFLNENEVHHLVRVFRAREGDLFEGLDSQGQKHRCELRRDAGKWYGEILCSVAETGESPLRITLAQALIKKNKFEWVIQKAVELGVVEIIPVQSERTEVRLSEQREEKKVKRWQRILEEAVKQSGRSLIPKLGSPVSLEELLDRRKDMVCIVMDEEGGASLKELLTDLGNPNSCLVLIGPEGGWGDRDRKLFFAHSATSVKLGPRILRTETASVVALSLLQYELGDL
jgi:16S rRNA (uracil1498-N3)-methyltransferase